MENLKFFHSSIASPENIQKFESDTHIKWDWRIETLARISNRLSLHFDIDVDAVYLFSTENDAHIQYVPYQRCQDKSKARKYDNINECLYYWKNLFPTYFSLERQIISWKDRSYSLRLRRTNPVYMLSCFFDEKTAEKYAKKVSCDYDILKNGILVAQK